MSPESRAFVRLLLGQVTLQVGKEDFDAWVDQIRKLRAELDAEEASIVPET